MLVKKNPENQAEYANFPLVIYTEYASTKPVNIILMRLVCATKNTSMLWLAEATLTLPTQVLPLKNS